MSQQSSQFFARNERDNSRPYPRQSPSPEIFVNTAGRPQGREVPSISPLHALFLSQLQNIRGIENAKISFNNVAGNMTYTYNENISATNKSYNRSFTTNVNDNYHGGCRCNRCRAPPNYYY
ncbi:hypothetical protein K435DRAFT_971966 [Dendrothele bispora CBS 962.96]|uniref:Uncharacterized protein n=1 Tax=Dendrothele bispora (strain CBS 962.96) TaxID=1314807 RepID=A0A4S8L1Y2_DENBC|nr:hypothetical protein K435DRAFT_971966 [Dendrothele bispora CBS 962.96]